MTKKKVWLSYAWKDNEEQDVDFIVQELERAGMEVSLDRFTIGAGRRLWEQIESFITSPGECDAWLWYATQNSMNSEPCREEVAYALDRALSTRGANFPMIALLQRDSSVQLLPASVRTRLCVSLADPHWLERVSAAAEGRQPKIALDSVKPFSLRVFAFQGRKAIEVRPRTGYWNPFIFAVPIGEKDKFFGQTSRALVCVGPRGMPGTFKFEGAHGIATGDNQWFGDAYHQEVSHGTCGFFVCDEIPSKIAFGSPDQWYIVDGRDIPSVYAFTSGA